MAKKDVLERGPKGVENITEGNISGGGVTASTGAEVEQGNVKEVCLQRVHGLDGGEVWHVSLKRGDGRENGGMVDKVLVYWDGQ